MNCVLTLPNQTKIIVLSASILKAWLIIVESFANVTVVLRRVSPRFTRKNCKTEKLKHEVTISTTGFLNAEYRVGYAAQFST
jgi:hypothetical protein